MKLDAWDLLIVAGCALVVAGVTMVYIPAGLIVGGAMLAWVGYQFGRGGEN